MSLSSLYGHLNIGKLLGQYGQILMSNWILEYHGVPMFRQTYIQEVLMHCTERGDLVHGSIFVPFLYKSRSLT